MNKLERVEAALAGREVDHIPASFWFHFDKSKAIGRPMAEAHLEYYEAADPDWLKVMNDAGYALPKGAYRGEKAIDLAELARPVPVDAECFTSFLEGYRLIIDAIGTEAPTIVTLFCPFATFNYATGKRAEELIRSEPEASEAALAAISESLINFSKACVAAGGWGMYYAAQAGEKDRLTPEEHTRFVTSFDRQVLDAISDAPFNFLHVCGEDLRLEPYWSYPASCINWATEAGSGNPTITEARKLTNMPIAAGLHNRGPLAYGPEEKLREEVKEAIEEGGRSKFLLAAGCTLPNDVDWDLTRIAREECIKLTGNNT